MQPELLKHLRTGSTTVCRAWKVTRKDGMIFGFTDHDEDLTFDDVIFVARTGFTASALQQTNGMSVDNAEVTGAISDVAISDADIMAGRFDGAEVVHFLVNWSKIEERSIIFKGSFGEITRRGGEFKVELRGLTEALNIPRGRVFQRNCSATLGDRYCKIDMSSADYSCQVQISSANDGRKVEVLAMPQYPDGWFTHGVAHVVDGVGHSQSGRIKSDKTRGAVRIIELWQGLAIIPEIGASLLLEAGCDRQAQTCREKFNNFLNFRGFPDIPGEDWLRAGPNGRR